MEDTDQTEHTSGSSAREQAATLLCDLRRGGSTAEAVARLRTLLARETAGIHRSLRPSPPDRFAARRALDRFEAAKARAFAALDEVAARSDGREPSRASVESAVVAVAELFDGPHADLVAWPARARSGVAA